MKGLLKYLSPFAPDQSGASAVLFEMGGLLVICDAGGCTGNICGFDEPRWFYRKSAIFSAGMRDMDAILGRDEQLVKKIKEASEKMDVSFVGLIGTTVPAVIATDFRALARMSEKKCSLPVIAVECIGTRLYDVGQRDAYLALFKKFVQKEATEKENFVGVLGATPLDTSCVDMDQRLQNFAKGTEIEKYICYGMHSQLIDKKEYMQEIKNAGKAKRNLVLSPSGYEAAKYLQKEFGTPYEPGYPTLDETLLEQLSKVKAKKVLIIHQQVVANEIRKYLRGRGIENITVASWFMMIDEWKEPQDRLFEMEDEYVEWVKKEDFDLIVGDSLFKRPLRGYIGEFIEAVHFAVSGKMLPQIGRND